MITIRPGDCGRFRESLVAFVDRRETRPDTDAALDHLERCRTCVRELEDTALAIAALRRFERESRMIEPAPDAWARLRARVDRPREAVWRWRASLAGLALSGALVAMIMGPGALWTSRQVYVQEAGLASGISDARLAEERAESLALAQQRVARSIPPAVGRATPESRTPTVTEVGWRGPDGAGVADAPVVEAAPPSDRTK